MKKTNFVSLLEANPSLAKEWHPTKNGNLTPADVTAFTNKKVWWYLPYDVPDDYPIEHLRGKHFNFEWKAMISNRTNGDNCPFLSGKRILAGFNDLQTVNPSLSLEWHPTKNGSLKPTDVTANSHQKVWWYLPYDVPDDYPIEYLRGKHFYFEWKARIADRNKGKGCPYLSGVSVWKGFNDLQTVNPKLVSELHPVKNGNLIPTDVYANSVEKVWWYLPYDVPDDYPVEHLRGKHFNFEWQATISHRNKGNGCPYLSGSKIWKGFNDLATINPKLAAQWHPTKNGNLTPDKISTGCKQKFWWYLPYDVPYDYHIEHLRGKHFNFEWQASIKSRNNGIGCPFLSGKAVWVGFNDLATINPKLAAEWHPTRNGKLTPDMFTAGSKQKVWWYLPYDVPDDYPVEHLRGKHFNFEWQMQITERNRGDACPYLSGHEIYVGFNDLQTVSPKLASEWHPTKNGKLTPDMFTAGSKQKVWWLLSYKVPDNYFIEHLRGKCFQFEWKASILNRKRGAICPYLSNPTKAIYKGFNDLQTTNPELAAQWHPTKNGNLTPDKIPAGSCKKVWWYLPYNDTKTGKQSIFEWQATIGNRVGGSGCPYLSESHGEQYIKKYLSNNELTYNCEETFDELKGVKNGLLSYDFHIKETKILIEYQGLQHYKPIEYFGGEKQFVKQKEHDKRKREYAKSHGYKLIEISYKYDTYEKVEEYLDKKLKPLLNINNKSTST